MKKTRIAILIALILIIGLFYYYNYKINVFDATTLENIDVRFGDFNTAHTFVLTDAEKTSLFNSLSSLYKAEDDYDEALKDATRFVLTLLNQWELSKTYEIYISKDFEVFAKINHEEPLYSVDDVDFFTRHSGFDSIYPMSQFPELQLNVDQSMVESSFKDQSWSFKRHNGSWADLQREDQILEETIIEIDSADTTLSVTSNVNPNESILRITDLTQSKLVFEGAVNIKQLPLPEYDGAFSYDLFLKWSDEGQDFKGAVTVSFKTEIALPEMITVSKKVVTQGDLIQIDALHVDPTDAISVEQTLIPTFTWYHTEGGLRGYIPTNYATLSGVYTLTFKNETTQSVYQYEVEVLSRSFKEQVFSVDPNVQASTQNDEAYEEYRRVFNPIRKTSHPERYYTEPFILPTEGKLTTEFGESRVVNGKPTNYRHTGIDIAAPTGTPVLATNTGKVVLATDMILLGKIVIIDHGEGLFSVVQHMDSITVDLGDMVTRGQQVGTVGSTGFSSGAHLHFMISYYETNLEPGYFLYGEAITKENSVDLMK